MDLFLGGIAAVAVVGGLALAGYAVRRLADATKALAETTAKLAIRRPVMVVDQTNKDMALEHKAGTLEGRQERVEMHHTAPPRSVKPAVHLVEPPESDPGWEGATQIAAITG